MLTLAFLALAALEPAQRPAAPPPKPAQEAPPKSAYVPRGIGDRGVKDENGPPVLAEDAVAQEEGVAGKLPPLARHVEWSVPSFDKDEIGRSRIELAGLAADARGFTVLQSDDRDGNRNYVLLPLDVDLAPRGPALRLDESASGRGETDAAIVTAGSGKLAFAWLDVEDEARALRCRAWDAESGGAQPWNTPLPIDRRPADERPSVPGRPPPRLEPALLTGDASWTIAVQVGGFVVLREVDPSTGAKQVEHILGSREQFAIAGPRLARDATGATACAYETSRGVKLFLLLGAELTANCDLGPGALFGLAGDPQSVEGGWWVLIRTQGKLVLRHLERSGAPDRPELELATRPVATAELAVGPRGVCVLAQYVRGGLDALWVDGASAEPAAENRVRATELRSAEKGVIAARLAFRGGLCAFAWTERNGSSVDLVACTARPNDPAPGAEHKLEFDVGGGLQFQPNVAFAGERGVVVWSDLRFGDAVIGARGFTPSRTQESGELFFPAEIGDASAPAVPQRERAPAKRPNVALQPSGRGLVTWLGPGAGGWSVFAQMIEVDERGESRALSKAIELDPGALEIPTTFAPAVVALRDEHFAIAWVRALPEAGSKRGPPSEDGRTEVRIARVNAAGAIDLVPRTVGSGSRLAHPALAQLDDGRVVLAWDGLPHVEARRLSARAFSEALEPDLRELGFETMWRKSDHTPAIAAAPGGFALAWISGEGPDSDVFARTYDVEGRPLSRPVALTTRAGGQRAPTLARTGDGDLVAIWQDDLSKTWNLVGRRFSAKSAQPGLAVHFGFGPVPRGGELSSPAIAALSPGKFLLVGEHFVTGKGREIGLSLIGPGWDEVEGR